MPDESMRGILRLEQVAGPALPPGTTWTLTGTPVDHLLRVHEGKLVEITITVLKDHPPETRPVRTIRDLTLPR